MLARRKLIKRRIIGFAFTLVLATSFFFYFLSFLAVVFSLSNLMQSIYIPASYMKVDFGLSNPSLDMDVRIINRAFYGLSGLELDISIHFSFYEFENGSQIDLEVFSRKELLGNIDGCQEFYYLVECTSESFNSNSLIYYNTFVDTKKEKFFLLDIKVGGLYCFGLVPFSFSFQNIDINEECQSCG